MAALQSPPQRYRIMIEPYHQLLKTTNAYALRTFYEGARGEGEKECQA
jgi:hypothetical protein